MQHTYTHACRTVISHQLKSKALVSIALILIFSLPVLPASSRPVYQTYSPAVRRTRSTTQDNRAEEEQEEEEQEEQEEKEDKSTNFVLVQTVAFFPVISHARLFLNIQCCKTRVY